MTADKGNFFEQLIERLGGQDTAIVWAVVVLVCVFIVVMLIHGRRSRGQGEVQNAQTGPAGESGGEADNASASDTQEESAEKPAERSLFSPLKGKVIPAVSIPDETFSSGVLGGGVGIEPTEGKLVAPFDGEISSVAESANAVGLTGPGDMEVLIHVGVDTEKMNGDGFELLVSQGDQVRKGQELMRFNIDKIREAGLSPVTAVLLINSDDYDDFRVVKIGQADYADKLFTIEP